MITYFKNDNMASSKVELPSEYKRNLKDAALVSLKVYLGKRFDGMNDDDNLYQSRKYSLNFLQNNLYGVGPRDHWSIIQKVWDNLEENIERKVSFECPKCDQYAYTYKIFTILDNWYSLYKDGTIELDECMICLYQEYISLSGDAKKEEVTKEVADAEEVELRDKALVSLKQYLGDKRKDSLSHACYMPCSYMGNLNFLDYCHAGYGPCQCWHFNNSCWLSLRDAIKTCKSHDIPDFISGCEAKVAAIYKVLLCWLTAYQQKMTSLSNCMKSLYREYICMSLGLLPSDEDEDENDDITIEEVISDVKELISISKKEKVKLLLEEAQDKLKSALLESKRKTVSQRISDFCENKGYTAAEVLSEFINYDDPAKLVKDDDERSLIYISIILKELINVSYGDSVVIRILQEAVYCDSNKQEFILRHVKDLSPKFDICVFKLFPEKFAEMDFNPLNILNLIVDDDTSTTVKIFLERDWGSCNYTKNKHYLFDLERSDMFKTLMGLPCEDYFFLEQRQLSIRGTKYEELIKDGPL